MTAAPNPAPDEDQPRTIEQPCSHCGHVREVLNGAHYRRLRHLSKLTLVEMGRLCGVGYSHLGKMERGREAFQPKYAECYERLFDRRRKAGEDWG